MSRSRPRDTAGDTPTYGLGGMDMDEFAVEPDTGQLMTRGALDYETRNIYIVTVTATDMAGAHASIDVTIMVTNVGRGGNGKPGFGPARGRHEAEGHPDRPGWHGKRRRVAVGQDHGHERYGQLDGHRRGNVDGLHAVCG